MCGEGEVGVYMGDYEVMERERCEGGGGWGYG